MYQLLWNATQDLPTTCIKRLLDNAFIPFDPDNTDYQKYLEWIAEGNTPLPSDTIGQDL